MTKNTEPDGAGSSARGEAAWKDTKQRIAARNDAARKAGKARRAAVELRDAQSRRAARRESDGNPAVRRRTP